MIEEPHREGKFSAKGEVVQFFGYTDKFSTYRFYSAEPVQKIIVSCNARFSIGNSTDNSVETTPEKENSISILSTDLSDETETVSHCDETADNPTEMSRSLPVDEGNSDDERTSHSSSYSSTDELIQNTVERLREKDEDEGEKNTRKSGALFSLLDEPRTLKDAQESIDWPNWKTAIEEELQALERNKTWIVIERPKNFRPIKNIWVLRLKLNSNGESNAIKRG